VRESQELTGAKELATRLRRRTWHSREDGRGRKDVRRFTATRHSRKLTEAGITIEKKRVHLHTPVKTLGKHTVEGEAATRDQVELNFDVVSENRLFDRPGGEEIIRRSFGAGASP